ncbi:MAG: DNA-binding response regulator [Bacteroidetes bacterium]|nr:MAG: DNA-binding response regulator [Bacteroidota bacterium]
MTLHCLVVDDEPVARKGLAAYVEQVPFLKLVASCKSALEAAQILHEQPVDLLFLDIQMPDLTGIEFVRTLDKPPAVIFTTAYREYAIEGFELQALDYLVKPISFERFLKAANRARQTLQPSTPPVTDHFFIKTDGQYVKIRLEEVLYFESDKDYLYVHTPKKRYMTLLSLKQLEQELPAGQFLRVHRSFIVNVQHIEALESGHLRVGGRQIPISRNLQQTLFKNYVEGRLWKRE